MRTTRILALILFVAVLLVTSGSAAKARPSLTKKQLRALIASASTAEDHLKLADFYRQDASRLEEEAAEHDKMREHYTKSSLDTKLPYPAQMPQHCERMAGYLRKAASEAQQLAAEHARMAEAARVQSGTKPIQKEK